MLATEGQGNGVLNDLKLSNDYKIHQALKVPSMVYTCADSYTIGRS